MQSLPEPPDYENALRALETLQGADDLKDYVRRFLIEQQKQVSTDPALERVPPPKPRKIEKGSQKLILCIEDDVENALLVQTIGQKAGYQVMVAHTAREGIEISHDYIPDLIICDYHLPGMHGFDAVREIRESVLLAEVPVIMLTADIYSQPESVELGIEEYVLKPIRRNMLLRYIEKHMQ